MHALVHFSSSLAHLHHKPRRISCFTPGFAHVSSALLGIVLTAQVVISPVAFVKSSRCMAKAASVSRAAIPEA